MEREESFHFPFGFETATRPWASFSRKKHTRIHSPFSPPFISLYFFLLSFSFSLIFAHFSIPISAHDPKEDWKESRANVSRLLPGINSPLFWKSPRKSRLRIEHSFSLFPLAMSLFKYTPFQYTLLSIVNRFLARDKTFFYSALNYYFKILLFHRGLTISVYI